MAPNRSRKKLNITFSAEARKMLEELAAAKGLTLARYLEMVTRESYAQTKAAS